MQILMRMLQQREWLVREITVHRLETVIVDSGKTGLCKLFMSSLDLQTFLWILLISHLQFSSTVFLCLQYFLHIINCTSHVMRFSFNLFGKTIGRFFLGQRPVREGALVSSTRLQGQTAPAPWGLSGTIMVTKALQFQLLFSNWPTLLIIQYLVVWVLLSSGQQDALCLPPVDLHNCLQQLYLVAVDVFPLWLVYRDL